MSKSVLTKREKQVFDLLVLNKSTLEIAKKLGISEKTVRNHISNVMQKLGVKGRAGAVIELLKLKEISYIHAEGYAAGEMKHGPIALIDCDCPVVVIMTKSFLYDKVISNIKEVSARQGIVIGVASEDDMEAESYTRVLIKIPSASPYASAILAVLPLQLLSYYIADVRGCNIDKPRNLAKSVTVE